MHQPCTPGVARSRLPCDREGVARGTGTCAFLCISVARARQPESQFSRSQLPPCAQALAGQRRVAGGRPGFVEGTAHLERKWGPAWCQPAHQRPACSPHASTFSPPDAPTPSGKVTRPPDTGCFFRGTAGSDDRCPVTTASRNGRASLRHSPFPNRPRATPLWGPDPGGLRAPARGLSHVPFPGAGRDPGTPLR